MPSILENPPFDDTGSSSEDAEAAPTEKHPIHWEREQGPTIKERRDFLELAIGEAVPSETGQEQYEQEFHQLLDHLEEKWSDDISYKDIIYKLREAGSVKPLVGDAYLSGDAEDEDDISALQSLSRAIIEDVKYQDIFDSTNNHRNWMNLSETDKRLVRLAEMTIFMTDVSRTAIDARKGNSNPTALRDLANNIAKYATRNTDVPESYKRFLRNAAAGIRQDLRRQESEDSTTPRSSARRGAPSPAAPRSTASGNYQKADRPRPAAENSPGDSDAIDMEYNPVTGAYEAAGENYPSPDAGPSAPPLLTYDPGTSSPDAGSEPSAAPPTPPSTPPPAAPPA